MKSQDALDLVASLKHGANRKKNGLFFAEGVKMVDEALSSGAKIDMILVSPEILGDKAALLDQLSRRGVSIVEASRRRYEKAVSHFVFKQEPQGIGALCRQSWASIGQFAPKGDAIAVALCSVQDAGNVGTILRTADAVGCSSVFVLGETADPYGPVAVRSSLGAVFSLTAIASDIWAFSQWASRTNALVIGTSPQGPKEYREVEYSRPIVLMLGNESRGLRYEEIKACHQVVRIPMVGRRNSLNVAVAGAVVLYEILHQGKKS